jgi:hypothetical protein
MQFHSTPVSEPAAIGLGVVTGLLAYACAAGVGADHEVRLWAGYVAAALANLVVGAKINIVMFDILCADCGAPAVGACRRQGAGGFGRCGWRVGETRAGPS